MNLATAAIITIGILTVGLLYFSAIKLSEEQLNPVKKDQEFKGFIMELLVIATIAFFIGTIVYIGINAGHAETE